MSVLTKVSLTGRLHSELFLDDGVQRGGILQWHGIVRPALSILPGVVFHRLDQEGSAVRLRRPGEVPCLPTVRSQ